MSKLVHRKKGYTLVELIVSVGLFAIVMMLATGAYLVMINVNRQSQAISTGINNLSFALDVMTRSIRTGTSYLCGGVNGLGDCPNADIVLDFTNSSNVPVEYTLENNAIVEKINNGNSIALTDPTVNVQDLKFYVMGSFRYKVYNDLKQPNVLIVVKGTVKTGPGKPDIPFTVQTGATMRGTDL